MKSESVLTVSELNKSIKSILGERKELKNIWVKGEILNYSQSGTGHIYFNLKDSTSTIRCAFFSFQAQNYRGKKLKDGLEIKALGSISVYEPGGYYSFSVNKIEELGTGDLLYQIEQLKQKLNEKGIFDSAHKKLIPKFPKTLGIATAIGGAAVEDIIRIAKERYPNINILIAPCLVQGDEAPKSIANAIKALNDEKWQVDVIIAGRGGGSFEDLMAFNTEEVVMAFFNSRIPIVSAVGHQVDNVLTDLVADASSPTPTAAAELVVFDYDELIYYLDEMETRFNLALGNKLDLEKERLFRLTSKLVFTEPMTLIVDRIQKTDEILTKIFLLGKNHLVKSSSTLQKFQSLELLIQKNLEIYKKKFELSISRVENFSPLETLKRGYSVLRDGKKKVISKIKDVKLNDQFEVILSQGRLEVEVKKIYE
ncbi:MAG: exodeoxyribonuclease VII large subunit [Leptospiraceae bacterium]|nr:exodeoxyribonuclease VII large subunit [Leptospiraceae bacterium]